MVKRSFFCGEKFAQGALTLEPMMKTRPFLALSVIMGMSLSIAGADTHRYRLSGDWSKVAAVSDAGWGLNPNNEGTAGASLPAASDEARINWAGNTVTVSSEVPVVNKVGIGVDESGTLLVASGGVLTATDIVAGNNGAGVTGKLIVHSGAKVNVGNILWAANEGSEGIIDVQAGGMVTAASHLWWGVNGKATITISGEVNQIDGILGLGTDDASRASGGNATVNISSGGKLNLNNISGEPGTPSIQAGSKIRISAGGLLTVKGDHAGSIENYIAEGKIVGEGGAPRIAFNPGTNLTSVSVQAVPAEP